MCIRDRGSGRKQPVALAVLAEGESRSEAELARELESLLDQVNAQLESHETLDHIVVCSEPWSIENELLTPTLKPVSYTHLRAHETVLDLVCRLLLEKKKKNNQDIQPHLQQLYQ